MVAAGHDGAAGPTRAGDPVDLYHILDLAPDAEPEVVDAAYRALARKYHPDVNRSPDAQRRMQALNDAYAVLRDPARRAAYDTSRHPAHARPNTATWGVGG